VSTTDAFQRVFAAIIGTIEHDRINRLCGQSNRYTLSDSDKRNGLSTTVHLLSSVFNPR
jgi:hypothetical protein